MVKSTYAKNKSRVAPSMFKQELQQKKNKKNRIQVYAGEQVELKWETKSCE